MKTIIIFLIFLCSTSLAQDMRKIAGIVLDFDSSDPILGVTVSILDTDISTKTYFGGEFSLIIPLDSCILKFSYSGYRQKLFYVYDTITTFDTVKMKHLPIEFEGIPMYSDEYLREKNIELSKNGMQKAQTDIERGVEKLMNAYKISNSEKYIADKYKIVFQDESTHHSKYRTAYNTIVLMHLREKYGHKFSNDLEFINWVNE